MGCDMCWYGKIFEIFSGKIKGEYSMKNVILFVEIKKIYSYRYDMFLYIYIFF